MLTKRISVKQPITDLAFWGTKPGDLIAVGTSFDDKKGVNYFLSGKSVLWAAVKGGNNDWAIYFGGIFDSLDYIKRHGHKVTTKNVSNLVEVSDEVLERYRK